MSKDMHDKDLENISGGADGQMFDDTGSGGGGSTSPGGVVSPEPDPPIGGAPDPTKEAPGSDPGHLDT